jgi:hypothetical protein
MILVLVSLILQQIALAPDPCCIGVRTNAITLTAADGRGIAR